MFLIKLC